jgi:hypothetical protein
MVVFRCKIRVTFTLSMRLQHVFTLFRPQMLGKRKPERSRNFIIPSFENECFMKCHFKERMWCGGHYYSEGFLVSHPAQKKKPKNPFRKNSRVGFEMFHLWVYTLNSLYYEKGRNSPKRKTLLEHVKPLFIWVFFLENNFSKIEEMVERIWCSLAQTRKNDSPV